MGRLIVDSRSRANAAAGLKRYNGKGIFSSIGRKASLIGLKKVESVSDDGGGLVGNNTHSESIGKQADETFDLKEGEGIVCDSIDGFSMPDEETSREAPSKSDSTEEEYIKGDKESSKDDDESPVKVDKETHVAGIKRKFPPSLVDFIINNNTDELSQPKVKCLDTSFLESREKDGASSSAELQPNVEVTDHDSQYDEGMSEMSANHHLSTICPTERKKWPQKKCVYCRQKYGIRNDTRYICMQCDVALCKEPCFSDYHCNK